MTQRKLTNDERQIVGSASYFLTKASGLSGGPGDCWRDAARQLGEMLNNGTTDGKVYVDPEPPIPDGYRLAVAGDEGRIDRKYWAESSKKWLPATCMPHRADLVFIVPADRTPTDEDAKSRPEVMVWGDGIDDPRRRVLVMVQSSDKPFRFLVTDADTNGISSWRHCRHLYPGE